ncbi:MAG: N-acetylmuramoyl-L-alanine amidase [Bacteroidota bacterium]|nr:N-acetylmuramoyl-L-alanine amidase [Bacteroidota bacterium]
MKTESRIMSVFTAMSKGFFLIFLLICFIPLTSFIPKLFPFGIKKIVIDAGHGGHDPGCLGSGSKEKDIALGIALKLGKYIEDNLKDVEVVYTRDTDKFIELHERAAIANRIKADLFICIHCNAGTSTAYGAETYVMGLHKTKDNLNVAKRENSAILMEKDYEKEYEGFDPKSDEANIMFSLYQSTFLDQSLNFASKVQNQFRDRVGRHDRGVKQAGFLVLYMTAMPSVLIETGFLTNKTDESFLMSDEGQVLMASAIYRAFKDYKLEIDGKSESIEPKEVKKPVVENNEKTVLPVNQIKNENQPDNKKSKEIKKPVVLEVPKIDGVIFKVQFATSSALLDIKPENFKGLTGVEAFEAGGSYRYVVGEEKNIDGAKRLQEEVRSKGYEDAFIISFKNGVRISVAEAIKELSK